jgi:large repetitive protein
MTLNGTVPPLTYKVTGFVNNETAAVVSGAPTYTTADGKTIGAFDIVCTIGTLDAQNYSFPAVNFIKGKLTVYYRWDGFLQPINHTAYTGLLEPSSSSGRRSRQKFVLKDAAGNVVQQSVNPTFSKTFLGASCGQTVVDSVDATVGPDPSTVYTWDGSQYHYNWSTKGLQGGEYRIYANLADGQKVAVNICLS